MLSLSQESVLSERLMEEKVLDNNFRNCILLITESRFLLFLLGLELPSLGFRFVFLFLIFCVLVGGLLVKTIYTM